MDIKRKVIDISSFLLFEATGDSETGCFDPAMSVMINHDDDDAESCSPETTTTSHHILPCVSELNKLEYKEHVSDDDDDGEVVQLREEGRLKCMDDHHQRLNEKVGNEEKSSSVSVDSTKTSMSEKNRLFWEACLAS